MNIGGTASKSITVPIAAAATGTGTGTPPATAVSVVGNVTLTGYRHGGQPASNADGTRGIVTTYVAGAVGTATRSR